MDERSKFCGDAEVPEHRKAELYGLRKLLQKTIIPTRLNQINLVPNLQRWTECVSWTGTTSNMCRTPSWDQHCGRTILAIQMYRSESRSGKLENGIGAEENTDITGPLPYAKGTMRSSPNGSMVRVDQVFRRVAEEQQSEDDRL
jgi:hypothetical protein